MDSLDFVPYLEFIRNDQETISIIAEASVIIPQVCDILGISLSESEGEEDERPGSDPVHHVQSGADVSASRGDNQLGREEPSASMTLLQRLFRNSHAKDGSSSAGEARTAFGEDQQQQQLSSSAELGKRGSQPITVSTYTGASAGPSAAIMVSHHRNHPALPPKKRRVQQQQQSAASSTSTASRATCTSQSRANNSSRNNSTSSGASLGSSPVDESLKDKLRQEIDMFNDKIRQLAALERHKNQLLENLLTISTAITEQHGSSGGGGSAENEQEEETDVSDRMEEADDNFEETEEIQEEDEEDGDSETYDISEDEDDDDDDLDFDSDDEEMIEADEDDDEPVNDTSELGEEEIVETTEVVEEQIVGLDMMEQHFHPDFEPNSYYH